MLRRPNCVTVAETADHAAVFRECLSRTPNLRGNILHDFHTAVILREHGVVEILSLDRDFRVFPWIRRVTPGGAE